MEGWGRGAVRNKKSKVSAKIKRSVNLIICQQEKKSPQHKHRTLPTHSPPVHTDAISRNPCSWLRWSQHGNIHPAHKKLTVGTTLHNLAWVATTKSQLHLFSNSSFSFKMTISKWQNLTCCQFVRVPKQPDAFRFLPVGTQARGWRGRWAFFCLLLLLDTVSHFFSFFFWERGAVLWPLEWLYHVFLLWHYICILTLKSFLLQHEHTLWVKVNKAQIIPADSVLLTHTHMPQCGLSLLKTHWHHSCATNKKKLHKS